MEISKDLIDIDKLLQNSVIERMKYSDVGKDNKNNKNI